MKKFLVIAGLLAASTSAFAQQKATTMKAEYKAPYGMAGCGLGAMLLEGKNDKGWQILALTLNGIYGNQTFGITTGTSNCVESTSQAAVEREVFVSANYNTLSKHAAQGDGESLEAFADILGCSDEVALPLFKKLSQEHYNAIFSSTTPSDVANNFVKEVKSSKELANRCERLG